MHAALADPKINAPKWPLLRLLALAGIAYAVFSVLSRVGRTFTEDGVEVAFYSVGAAVVTLFSVVVVLTGLAVRRLRAIEAHVPQAGEQRVLFPTFGFGATGARMLAISGVDSSVRGLWGWKLVEVTSQGVRVHANPDHPELTRTFAASAIVDAAPGAITDGMLRIPTLNLAVETGSGTVGLPLGLLRHPLAVMSADERAVTVAQVRRLLGVPHVVDSPS